MTQAKRTFESEAILFPAAKLPPEAFRPPSPVRKDETERESAARNYCSAFSPMEKGRFPVSREIVLRLIEWLER